jgi:hypothetical protein
LLDEVAERLHEALQGVRMMIQIANGEEHGPQDRVESG